MKKYIGLVCGAVLFALLAAGCSGAFGFDGKDVGNGGLGAGNGGDTGNGGGTGTDGSNKDNPFKGTTWENSTNGFTLEFTSDDECKITEGTTKAASIAREATAGQINASTYSYTWKLNDDGSFTATLTIYHSTRGYATFTITASGESGMLTITASGATCTFEKKTGGTGTGTGTGTGSGTETEPPDTFTINDDGKLVKYTIGDKTDITIPDTVRYIGASAFQGCRTLTSVTIPASVESIGLNAFSGCPYLKVYYDGTKEKWNHILFYTTQTVSTTTATGLDGKTITGNDNTSWKFDNLDSLVWKCRVGMEIYDYTKSEEIVRIPLGTLSIARASNDIRIFEGKTAIKQVIMPDTVIEILSEAFSGCTGLESISISNGITSIVNKMFIYCTSLASVTIPDSVTRIESQAFEDCKSLASVSLPEGLTSIGLRAFRNCTSLTGITIPDTVTDMGAQAFFGCESLERVSIPVGMTTIAQRAFQECKKLESVTIPASVTTILPEAFYGCEALKEVSIPNSVTLMDTSAFGMCNNLATVNYDGTEEQWNAITRSRNFEGKMITGKDANGNKTEWKSE